MTAHTEGTPEASTELDEFEAEFSPAPEDIVDTARPRSSSSSWSRRPSS